MKHLRDSFPSSFMLPDHILLFRLRNGSASYLLGQTTQFGLSPVKQNFIHSSLINDLPLTVGLIMEVTCILKHSIKLSCSSWSLFPFLLLCSLYTCSGRGPSTGLISRCWLHCTLSSPLV